MPVSMHQDSQRNTIFWNILRETNDTSRIRIAEKFHSGQFQTFAFAFMMVHKKVPLTRGGHTRDYIPLG